MTAVILNNGWRTLGGWAFDGCRSLVCIGIRVIKNLAFKNCTGLTTAILGNGLQEIGLSALYQCTPLVRIVITLAVRLIEGWAFMNCRGLTTMILGNGPEVIGKYAFNG